MTLRDKKLFAPIWEFLLGVAKNAGVGASRRNSEYSLFIQAFVNTESARSADAFDVITSALNFHV